MTWGFIGKDAAPEEIYAQVDKGWTPILKSLIADLLEMGWDGTVYQVKEKFAGLRFYIGEGSDAIYARINDAENSSLRTCEYCGAPGKLEHLNGGYWLKTLCQSCHARYTMPLTGEE